ncbi:GNAT family N-acetyltransferase [Paenibacillus cellulositrophicus]|uniref:GNAT family N-acetyltransferase n=1 Tax=Paenibacillus cellulositrophicus TaxID=562959 RepID=UPI00204208C4|nr:GNAT family N-acetyltransferase [Paenibacillus cellulositrophicus]MCM2999999.1 GNAT family N-acetyltransferase [Paenibacillus cellulositrophicus]
MSDLNTVYIETERLVVRSFGEKDFEQFTRLLDLYGGWQRQKPKAKEFFDWHLSNYEKMDIITGTICLGVFEKETGEILGQVAAQEHDDLNEPEFGYGILPYARGKGYAKEAAKGTLGWIEGKYDIPYIIGTVAIDNIPSQKVLEYCGFQLVNEQNLLIHMMNERHDFKYYRYYLKYP